MARAGESRSRGSRRLAIGLVVTLAVLLGVALVVDRVGAWAAERTIAEQVSREVEERGLTASEPDVSVGGFPFLTQVIGGRYESITIVLRDVHGGGLRLPVLDVEATGVTAELNTLLNGSGPVVADLVTGTATIGYSTVSELSGQPDLRMSAQDGQLRVQLPVELLGERLTLVGVADVAVDEGRVQVRISQLTAEQGDLPPGSDPVVAQLRADLSLDLNLPPLPYGLQLEDVRPGPGGLEVTATARNVPLAG